MKLTNYIRQAFVSSAMLDVPKVDYSQKISDLVQATAVLELPFKLQAVWKDLATRQYIKTGSVHYRLEFVGLQVAVPSVSQYNGEAPKACSSTVQDLLELWLAQTMHRNSLRTKITAVAASCTTRKALVEALPEFANYLPAETETTRNLPAIQGVLSDFVKAGWPKDAKKLQAKEAASA